MNAYTAFKEEIAEHERNAGESDPVLVSVCIGRAAMRFRAELDDYAHGDYDIEYDGDGFLCSLLLGLMHWTASAKFNDPKIPALNFDEELERARKMFREDTAPLRCKRLLYWHSSIPCIKIGETAQRTIIAVPRENGIWETRRVQPGTLKSATFPLPAHLAEFGFTKELDNLSWEG